MKAMPPLNPLRVFEVAARHGNFTRAAEELGVSQSAVSRQVSVLEEFLGIQLFTRVRGEVMVTPVGMRYEAELTKAFELIASATQNIPQLPKRRAINVRATPAFMHSWLVPRIGAFRKLHPDIGINFTTTLSFAQLDRQDVDIAIQGPPTEHQRDVVAEPLMENVIAPVCSPSLLERNALLTFEDLARTTILDSRYRSKDWRTWLDSVGAPQVRLSDILTFESSSMVYVATGAGLGVAIAQLPLLQDQIERGELVLPFSRKLTGSHAFYVVSSPRSVNMSAVTAFRGWLLKEGKASSDWAKSFDSTLMQRRAS